MKYIYALLVAWVTMQQAYAQTPTYQLVLKNDSLVSSAAYVFDIYVLRTGTTPLELAALQLIHTFNTAVSSGTLSYTIDAGTSDLIAAEQPSNGKLSIVGNELLIAPNSPPGTGSGTVIPAAPGLRIGRFRITSSVPFANRSANIAWKNINDPYTKVFAYVGATNTEITDSTGHLNNLANGSLSPLAITSTSPRPAATAGISYIDSLTATGGTLPYSWSLSSGSLPTGFTLASSGLISGTTTVAGTYSFAARVTDSLGTIVTKALSLTVNPAVASQLAFIQQPTNDTAGTIITPAITVQIQDAFANNVPTSGIAIAMTLSSGTGLLSGTTTRTTSGSGLATFNDLSINLVGSKNLTASSTGLTSAVSNAFTISAGPATHLVFIQQPTNTVSQTTISPPVTVQLRDASANDVTSSGISVTMTLSSGTGTLSGTITQTTDVTGLATFNDLKIDLAGSKNLTASSGGLTSAVSNSFTISAGPATQLAIAQQPTNDTAGTVITPPITVQLKDAVGNNVSSSGVAVTMTLSSGTGTLSGTSPRSTDANGVATFNDLSINLTGSKNLTMASSGLTSVVSNSFTIAAAAPSQLLFVQQPTDAAAGALISPAVTVQVKDALGNNVPTSGISIAVSISSGTGTLSGTATQLTDASGLATFGDLRINSAGLKNFTAASGSLTSAVSSAFTVSAGTLNNFLVEAAGGGSILTQTAGSAFTLRVTARDTFNNTTTSFSGTVIITSTGTLSAGGGTTAAFTGGVLSSQSVTITNTGSFTITATNSAGPQSGTSNSFTVNPSAASQIAFVQQPTNDTAGTIITPAITVQLKDAFGNNVPTSGVSILASLSSGTGTLSGTTTHTTNASGLATFNDLSINLVGSKNLTASSTGLTSAVSNAFTISAGPATHLVFIQQPTNTVSLATISPPATVQLRDASGNNAPSSGISVTMAISSGTGTLSGTTTHTTDVTGLATFNDLKIDLAGLKNLTASSTGLTSAVSNSFTISAGAATQLAIVQQPTNDTAGTIITPPVTVQLKDAAGNDVASTGVLVSIALTTGSGTLSGTSSQGTNAAGVAAFNDLSINLAGSKNLTASSTGLTLAVSNSFTISAGPATQLVFIQQPTNTVALATISPPATAQLRDASGNNATTSGVSVTMALSRGTGTLSGTTTKTTDVTGLATFNDLRIDLAGLKNLTASSTGLTSAVSNNFTISAGAATQLAFVQQPTNDTAGTVITPAIAVQLKDAVGNDVSSSSVAVTMTLSFGTGTLSGTTPRSTDANGVATFNDLSINLTGSKNLTAASTGLTSAVSSAFTISAGAATHLLFVQQPTNDTAGTIMTPPVTAQLKDAAGNDVASTGVLVSITLTTGSGTLSGTTSRATNSAGLVTFNDLSIDLFGSKNLTASSTGLTSAVSAAFTISPGPLNNFLVESSGGGNIPTQTAGVAFTIRITARDANTNTVTGFTGTVDITSTGVLSSGSGTTPAFTSGVLSSRSVTISNGGSFTVTATQTGGGPSGTSNAFTVNNPLPTTTSISPTTKTAGDPTFTITVNGTNFVAASVVRFNGSNRGTTFASSTQLTATIPASDLTIAGTYNITVFNPLPGGGTSNPQTFTVHNTVANLKVFLEGAYRAGSMPATLRNSGFLPLTQPYGAAPWSYSGAESVGSIPVGVVDWVLIELRTGTSAATRVARRAAFVKTDGTVVDTNGASAVAFPGILTGNYYVVLRHRNHLAAMTASQITLNDISSLYDFTTGLSKYFGGDSKTLGGGRFGMYGGDYSADNFIDAGDFTGPDNELFLSGYRRSDLNMDGFIDAADFIYPDNNIFKGTNVPN